MLPVLAALQQVDHVQVQLLLPLPLLLRRVSERRGKIVLSFLSSHAQWEVSANAIFLLPCTMQRRLDLGKRPSKEEGTGIVMFGCRLINQLVAYAASIYPWEADTSHLPRSTCVRHPSPMESIL